MLKDKKGKPKIKAKPGRLNLKVSSKKPKGSGTGNYDMQPGVQQQTS